MSIPPLTISAIIPTRHRAVDLGHAVASILGQERLPDELIIVDQSTDNLSKDDIVPRVGRASSIRLVYLHDTSITGLVDAKRVGSACASGELVCFLEDDVVLEPAYFRELERGFNEHPDMIGSSGVITNQPHSSSLYRALHGVFFRGIFKDGRPAIYERAARDPKDLLPSHVLSGGLSAWRRRVFERVSFDVRNGFFMFEDMEFATRVVKEFGPRLYVNPRARLEHNFSPVNRDVHGARQRRKTSEACIFYKTRRDWPGARSGLGFAMCWWLGEAVLQSMRLRTLGPLRGYFRGIADGSRRPLVSEAPMKEAAR